MRDYPLEGAPTDDQKERLEGWLREMFHVSRKYAIFPEYVDGEIRIVDADTEHTIGIDLVVLTSATDPVLITSFDCDASILDGVWPIDTPTGSQEQRLAGRVWPQLHHHGDHP